MANALQESVFAAIDTLVGQRIDTLKLDKTVTATIVSCTNSLTGEYKVSYNGGTMTAYANEGTTYSKNTEVYVLVPQNDFTKTKYIVSKAQALANDNNISFVSSALSNYNLIGRNIIFDKKKNLPQGVCSYYPFDNCLIYDRDDLENSLVTINDEEFVNNLKEAEALMVEASFLTKLLREHRLTSTGNYGVKFTLAFKDASNSKVQLVESEDIVNNVQIDLLTSPGNIKDFNEAKEKIVELQKELEEIWANPNLSLEDKQKLTNDVNNKIASWVNINTTNDNPLSDTQQKEIQDLLDNQDYKDTSAGNVSENQEEYVKYYDYVIDSNNMTGNPFAFNTWADQYGIYPIEVENFLYIQRIVFYCENFVSETTDNVNGYSDDIFIKELEIYGLKTISAKSGDYSLSLSMPYGSTFKTLLADEYLEIVSKLNNKNANISDSSMFYWFIEDNRITSTSEYYQYYGGAGWKYLKDKKNTPNLIVSGAENRAYENKYLCVGIYQDTVILKEYFTLYNDAARRQLEIISSLGVNFSFDQGTPRLTCLIDGKSEDFESGTLNPKDDDHYRFIWSKTDEFGSSTVFNQTIGEVDAEIDRVTKDPDETRKGQILLELKARKQALQGVNFEVGKNWLEYPMKLVRSNGSATFRCSVYKTDESIVTDNSDFYPIGSAEIILQNSSVATPTDYYIIIENGDQVFQYSESGVSPDDERYQDPLEIKPLTCHFFYPSGEEVEPAQYTVKWLVPISDTMIVTPKDGMISNPATGRIEWSTSQIYPTQIKGDYNYQALNNQVTCIVNFNNQEYTKETSFLFTKVGENGTNGTDLVGKISPIVNENINIFETEMLTLRVKNMIPFSCLEENTSSISDWNNGFNINDKILEFSLYQRNEKLDGIDSVKWKMACGSNSYSKHMQMPDTIDHETIVNWATDKKAYERKFESLIVRAQCTYRNGVTEGSLGSPDTDTYYAFYGIPVINYWSTITEEEEFKKQYYHIGIDTKQTLKTILYNADGRNPMYNKNQGIKINIDSDKDKYILWKAEGGFNNTSPAFSLFKKEITEDDQEKMIPLNGKERELNLTEIWITPNDVYDGAYTNNLVHGFIYDSETNENWEAEIYIPIHMSLNTYGLASLNGWDGNHIDINEDDGFILAPQIGAGLKENKDNTFTGIVMGTVQTYGMKEDDKPEVGLFGYSGGKQSIFLDARTGNATFGLPESNSSIENEYTEGRIELRPGGESKVGSWRIGSKSLFSIYDVKVVQNNGKRELKFVPSDPDKKDGSYTQAPNNAQIMVPHNKAGTLLNSFPSFLTLKTPPITKRTKENPDGNADLLGIDFAKDNMAIMDGDAISLELDPNKSSIFTIYRNTLYDEENKHQTKKWRRVPLVGINSNGKFYTNSLKADESSFDIGGIDAFGTTALQSVYVGLASAYNGANFYKTFVNRDKELESQKDINLPLPTTYITSGTRGDERIRPISMHGKTIGLYAAEHTSDVTSTITKSKIVLKEETENADGTFTAGSFFAGNTDTCYLNLDFNANKSSLLKTINDLNVAIPETKQLCLTNNISQITLKNEASDEKGLYINTFNYNTNISGSHKEAIPNGDYTLTSRYCTFQMSDTIHLEVKDNNSAGQVSTKIHLNPTTNGSTSALVSGTGWDITTNGLNHGINIVSTQANEGINLKAIAKGSSESTGVVIAMSPDQMGTNSKFSLRTPQGTFESKSDIETYDKVKTTGFVFSSAVRFENGGYFKGVNGSRYGDIQLAFTVKGKSHFSDNIYAYDFDWLSALESGTITCGNPNESNWSSYDSTNIWKHIKRIYEILNTELEYLRDWRTSVNNSITSINDSITTINNKLNKLNGHTHKHGYYEIRDEDKVYYNRYRWSSLMTTNPIKGSLTIGEHQHGIDNTGSFTDFDNRKVNNASSVIKSLSWVDKNDSNTTTAAFTF